MATREPDLTGYNVGTDPKPDQAVEVLCRDQFGGYNLPFLCYRRDNAWVNADTGRVLDIDALGWRLRKGFKKTNWGQRG
jgi:hypothetical protein